MTSATGEAAVGMGVGVKREGNDSRVGLGVGDGGGIGVGVGQVLTTFVGLGAVSVCSKGTKVGDGVSLPKAQPLSKRKAGNRTGIRNRNFITLLTTAKI